MRPYLLKGFAMNILTSHLSSIVVLSLLYVATSSGCVKYERVASESRLGSHYVSISPACQNKSTRSRNHQEKDGSSRVLFYEFTCGDITVLIRDNMLSVNDKPYGLLNDGDTINIDYGKVRVNSKVRSEVR